MLATWYPLPPDNGSKARTFQLLRALAARHRVALVTFRPEMGPADAAALRDAGLCHDAVIVDRGPTEGTRLRRVLGLFSPLPSHLAAAQAQAIVTSLRQASHGAPPDVVLGSDLAAAVAVARFPAARRALELHNFLPRWLDEHARAQPPGARRLRARLRARKSLRFERRLYRRFDLVAMVSDEEVAQARAMRCEAPRIVAVPNGFDPDLLCRPRSVPTAPALIYTGALTYGPNRDAALWFGADILPRVRAIHPDATFTVTGGLDGVDTRPFRDLPGVVLSGYMADVTDALGVAAACVIPLRGGAGTRVKALEAMALGVPVVATTKGVEGLGVTPGEHCLIGDDGATFAAAVVHVLDQPAAAEAMASRARAFVAERYGWDRIGARFVDLLEEVVSGADRTTRDG